MAKPSRPRPPSATRRRPAVNPKKAKHHDWLGRPIRKPRKK